jgi:hypothetical protein
MLFSIVAKIVYIMDLTSFGTLLYFARRSNNFLKLQFTHLKLFKSLKMDKKFEEVVGFESGGLHCVLFSPWETSFSSYFVIKTVYPIPFAKVQISSTI